MSQGMDHVPPGVNPRAGRPGLPVRSVSRVSEVTELDTGGWMPSSAPPVAAAPSGPSLVAAMLRVKWLILSVALLVMVVSVPLIWLLMKPYYKATAVLRIKPVVPRLLFSNEMNGSLPFFASFVNTEMAVMKSSTVLGRVLMLQEVKDTKWYDEVKEGSLVRDRMTHEEALKDALEIRPRLGTEMIDISVAVSDPRDAQVLATAIIEEYKAYNAEMAFSYEGDIKAKLGDEMKKLQQLIDGDIQTKFNMAANLGSISPEEIRIQLTNNLNNLKLTQQALVQELRLGKWQLEQIEATASRPADGTTVEPDEKAKILRRTLDPEWAQLKLDLESAEAALTIDRNGEAHPARIKLVSGIELLKKRMADREKLLEDMPMMVSQDGVVEGTGSQTSLEYTIQRNEKRLELLNAQVKELEAQVQDAGNTARKIAGIDEEIRQRRELYEAMRNRRQVLEVEKDAPTARVQIESAAPLPNRPETDRRVQFSLMAIVGALGLGIGVGYLRILMDKRIYEAGEVQSLYQVPFLGLLPKLPSTYLPRELGGGPEGTEGTNGSTELVSGSRLALMESIRMVRTALLERVAETNDRVVLVTSALISTGKTSVAVLLAQSLAVVGKRVLLVEADLRRPVLAERLNVSPKLGLAALLCGKARIEQVVTRASGARFDVATAGDVPSDFDPELLANGVFTSCLSQWREDYDFILLDSPPLLPVADAQILAAHADSTLLVVRSSHDRRREAALAYSQLTAAGGRLLGTVLIGGGSGKGYGYDKYGYGYGGYGYGYGYGGNKKSADESASKA